MSATVSDLNRSAVQRTLAGDLEGAVHDCDIAIRADPSYFESYFNRGVVHKKLHKYASAIADFTKAIDQFNHESGSEGLSMMYYMRGSTLHDEAEDQSNKRSLSKAIKDYDLALKIDPNNGSAQKNIRVARRQVIMGL